MVYALICLLVTILVIIASVYLWMKSQNLDIYKVIAMILTLSIPSYIAVFALRELTGIATYPVRVYGFITIGVFGILIIEMIYLSKKIK